MLDAKYSLKHRQISRVSINGKVDDVFSSCMGRAGDDICESWSVIFHKKEVFDELLLSSFEEIGEHFAEVVYLASQNDFGVEETIVISCEEHFNINIIYSAPYLEWKKPYSFKEFCTVLSEIEKLRSDNALVYNSPKSENTEDEFEFSFLCQSDDIVHVRLANLMQMVKQLFDDTTSCLLLSLDKEVITTFFYFPEEIKIPCQQYLLYFSQFLMDLGIEAKAEVKEEFNKILLRVKPKDKCDALDKIREALEVYLVLPGMEGYEVLASKNTDMASLQLKLNVMHLKGQLLQAQSVLQMKDATIESLQLSNYQYRQLLNANSLNAPQADEEEIVKGIVAVKKFDGKGFSVNIPEIVRRLKRKWTR